MKDFLEYDEQIKLLTSRGIIINDYEFAIRELSSCNYYNIINGYKRLFLDFSSKEEKYINGTTFEEIYALYDFDKKLRDIILKPILKIENHLKTLIAYEFSKIYGNSNYIKFENFETLVGSVLSSKAIANRTKNIQELVFLLNKDLSESISKKDYIDHYMNKYGFVPLWVLVNVLSFGRISKFFSIMKQPLRVEISKKFNLKESDLIIFISLLSKYRNLCAHDERVFDIKIKNINIPDTNVHKELKINKINGNYLYGRNGFFSLLITLKCLLNKEDFTNLMNKVNGTVESLKKRLIVIDMKKIFEQLGFPLNWYDIKKI